MQLAEKIIIADDHPLFRTAMQQAVKQVVPNIIIEQADSLPKLQLCLEEHADADLVLLDLHMPGAHGFSGLVFLRTHYPDIPVMVVSACEDPMIMCEAVDLGASGYIDKSSSLDDISNALKSVLEGNIYLPTQARNHQYHRDESKVKTAQALGELTRQQFRVLTMMTEGMLNKQIAYDLEVSEATIKAHVTAIFRKLGVRTRTQAVIAVQSLDIETKEFAPE